MNRNSFITGLILLGAATSLTLASDRTGSTNLFSDETALRAFIDRIVTDRMQQAHVPGAVVTVVKADRVVFNKGYGFASLEKQVPVDPDKTLFRVASVSKVFNAMTVMRLVDEGIIDVNEDVQPRLAAAGLELDNKAYGPLTLKALLTHSAGIRDLSIPNVTSTADPAQVLPLGAYLKQCLPLRWQEPGEAVLYTDHGIALAGYVVELASKTRFQDAVLQKVLRPLAMSRTCYAVPEEQRTNLAVAYAYGNSGCQAIPFRYVNYAPAVGVLTTGSDMARLMICHLSSCKGFLKPATVKLMHEPQYADDARLGVQWTCGFVYETYPRGKEPYLFHIGYAYGFQSVLGISLSRGIAVFSAQNLQGPRVFQLTDLLDGLSGHEARTKSAEFAKPSVTAAAGMSDIQSLVGTYVPDRTLSRGLKLSKEDYVYVRYAEDIKGIEVEYWPTRDHPIRFIQVAPMLFCSRTTDQAVSFRMSKDGKRTYLVDYNMRGDGAFRRIATSDYRPVLEGGQPE
ncbi:MAG TPA: serine hydrolase domain-containing protein [Candidatus Sulfotelmatobacter sp.]|nr:serine hydrolase domain-containing protein [Candidatus Sulfotelmatobacter sp.]